jgi:glycerol-3-phosphate dehydrogenase (NAD(P)+)
MKHISVIGSGAWGTALAVIANRAGANVLLWTRNPFVLEAIHQKNRNTLYLPDVFLDPAITVTDSLARACSTELVLLVTPAQHVRSTCIAMANHLAATIPVVVCAKGIERGSLAMMSEVVSAVLPKNPLAILSGPNFAIEAARGLPTATTVACADAAVGEQIAFALGTSLFRPYVHDDVMGVQVGGAIKNVIAIACGIARGKGLGENAVAALMTRALTEMRRLAVAKGGRMETLMGLSGFGDLVLTCTSELSRNMSLGIRLGQGETLEKILSRRGGVTEGVATAESVHQLAAMLGIEMPICQAVYDVLYQHADLEGAVAGLLDRPFTRDI